MDNVNCTCSSIRCDKGKAWKVARISFLTSDTNVRRSHHRRPRQIMDGIKVSCDLIPDADVLPFKTGSWCASASEGLTDVHSIQ